MIRTIPTALWTDMKPWRFGKSEGREGQILVLDTPVTQVTCEEDLGKYDACHPDIRRMLGPLI